MYYSDQEATQDKTCESNKKKKRAPRRSNLDRSSLSVHEGKYTCNLCFAYVGDNLYQHYNKMHPTVEKPEYMRREKCKFFTCLFTVIIRILSDINRY